MATTIDSNNSVLIESNKTMARLFAQWMRAYLECTDAVQMVIREMVEVANDPQADDDEKQMAVSTILECLFPTLSEGGFDLEDLEAAERSNGDTADAIRELDRDEETFAERVATLLVQRGWTQEQLAEAVGVGQPAISMVLSRTCRPQRKTVETIAAALNVSPTELWPTD